MARKNFKSGLGELITKSGIEIEEVEEKKEEPANSDKLNFVINQLRKELHLWRTGKLTVNLFEESIKAYDLEYDAKTNQFKKI